MITKKRSQDSIAFPSANMGQEERAVRLVHACEAAELIKLSKQLRLALAELQTKMEQGKSRNDAKRFVHIVSKGLRYASRSAGTERHFVYGYYVAKMENLIEVATAQKKERDIHAEIMTRVAFAPIVRYLHHNGTCQQKKIATDLGMDKANLSREMRKLEESGFVNRIKGNKFVYYELTPQGYVFCNQYFKLNSRMESPLTLSHYLFSKKYAQGTEHNIFCNQYFDLKSKMGSHVMISHYEEYAQRTEHNSKLECCDWGKMIEVHIDLGKVGDIKKRTVFDKTQLFSGHECIEKEDVHLTSPFSTIEEVGTYV